MNIVPKTWGATAGAGAAGAITTIIVWAVGTYGHVQIPNEVAGAFTTLLTTAGAFAGAYIAPRST